MTQVSSEPSTLASGVFFSAVMYPPWLGKFQSMGYLFKPTSNPITATAHLLLLPLGDLLKVTHLHMGEEKGGGGALISELQLISASLFVRCKNLNR